MYLFFDTETTGIPKSRKAPVKDVDNWPRVVQLAWILQDSKDNTVSSGNYIIKPDGFIIPLEATKIHGISTDRALKEGQDLTRVLRLFSVDVDKADLVIAHNMSFDEKIIGAEFYRTNVLNTFTKKEKLCTMLASTEFCEIPGGYPYKWPKLSELHHKLFGKYFDEAHNAAADIEATARCFWALKEKNIL